MISARAMAVAVTARRVAMTLLLAVLTTATAWGDILSSDGQWYYNEVAGGCNITGKKTEDGDPTGITSLTIPKTIDGKTVLGFSPNAFSGFTNLQTIRFYQDAAVQNMPYVQHANFTTVELINNNGVTIYSATNHLPDAMTDIGNAFKGSGIKELTMPNVTSIGDRAFEGCNSLESVTFGQAVSIAPDSYPFSKINNKKLENGVWVYTKTEINYPGLMANWSCYNYQYSPNLVVKCDDGSCGWCGDEWSDDMQLYQNSSCLYWTLLDNNGHLTIDCVARDIIDPSKQTIKTESWGNANVKSLTLGHVNLEYNVLNDYPNLTTVTISENVTSSSSFPFDNCTSLTTIVVDSNNPLFDSRDDCNAIIETATNTLVVGCKNTSIPNSVTTIGWAAFSGCTDLISVSIPNSVTTIEWSAFSGCTSLHSVIIPNSVTTIEQEVFNGCTSLTSITIPNSVTTIEYKAFEGCTSLASVTIPNRVTTIKEETFKGCNSLASVTIPKSVTTIKEDAFYGCI